MVVIYQKHNCRNGGIPYSQQCGCDGHGRLHYSDDGGYDMRTILIPLMLFVLVVFTSSALAVDYESPLISDSPVDIIYDVNGDYSGGDFLIAYGGTEDSVYAFDPSGMGSQTKRIDNLPNDVTCIAIVDGDAVLGFSDGRIIRFENTPGIVDYSNDTDKRQTLATLPSACNDILVDGNDDVFVSSGSTIYKLSSPYYSQSAFLTDSNGYGIQALGNHPAGLLYCTGSSWDHYGKIKLYDGSFSSTIYTMDGSADFDVWTGSVVGVHATTDSDIYFTCAYRWGTAGTHNYGYERTVYLNYNVSSYDYSSTYYSHSYGDFGSDESAAYNAAMSGCYKDIAIDSNGVILIVDPASDTISTFSTDGLVGGYSPTSSEPSGGDSEYSSNETYIDPDQTTNDYVTERVRDLTPMAVGFFELILVLFFCAILLAFGGGGGKKR